MSPGRQQFPKEIFGHLAIAGAADVFVVNPRVA
jgi:hypothetical protein